MTLFLAFIALVDLPAILDRLVTEEALSCCVP